MIDGAIAYRFLVFALERIPKGITDNFLELNNKPNHFYSPKYGLATGNANVCVYERRYWGLTMWNSELAQSVDDLFCNDFRAADICVWQYYNKFFPTVADNEIRLS